MCGRVRCTLHVHQVAQAWGVNPNDASAIPIHQIDRYRPSYNVSPGAYLPVFRVRTSGPQSETAAGPTIQCMKWGLVPSFTKKNEKPDHYRMFNARSESIKEKASFRRLIPNNRCVVAVEGFYEWKKDGSKKQPYYIHFKDDKPLVFAALYDSWENSEGEVLHTFTILTTRCSSALEWLHDRMPVILKDTSSIDLWLNNSAEYKRVLGPCEDPDLVWHPVTAAMGKPSFDGPDCIKEIQLKPAGEKPLSMFFAKKTENKGQSDLLLKSPKQDHALDGSELEPKAEDAEQIVLEEKKDFIQPEMHGIKREFVETETTTGHAIKREFEETKTSSGQPEEALLKPMAPLKKKQKGIKGSDDKQTSLLSFFDRR